VDNQRKPGKELEDYLDILREKLPEIREQYNVRSMSVFGSYLHQTQSQESDLDLLVEFEVSPTLFQFIRLENYLTKILGVNVDLVMKDALKPAIGKRVLKEAQPL